MKALKIFLSLALVFSALAHYEGTTCNHDQVQHEPELIDVDDHVIPSEGEGEGRTLADYPTLRIYSHFDLFTQGTPEFQNYIKTELIPPAISYFQSALKIKAPLLTPLKVTAKTALLCGIPTPFILQTTGVAADHFVFFMAENAPTNYVATSTYCSLSSSNKRPIISKVMFNLNFFKEAGSDVLLHEKNLYTLIHEMTHSFGFSAPLYKNFQDDNGALRVDHVKSVVLDGKERMVFDLPSLTSRVRSHYGCASLPGAFLENNGGAATVGSHFERRHFLFDMMTSGELYGSRISQFTLAVLEGTGWYAPDYTFAEPYHFGAGQGCDFLMETCPKINGLFDEFCTTPQERRCSNTGRGGAKCMTDNNADGCQYYIPSVNYDCENPNSVNFAGRLATVQVFGRETESKCFSGTLASSIKNTTPLSFCFKYNCIGSGANTILEILIGPQKVTCTSEGQQPVAGYKGAIDCPDPLTFCQTVGKKYCPRNCLGRGKCISGKCACNKGYTGVDCALKVKDGKF